jgi:hypothetical protein
MSKLLCCSVRKKSINYKFNFFFREIFLKGKKYGKKHYEIKNAPAGKGKYDLKASVNKGKYAQYNK